VPPVKFRSLSRVATVTCPSCKQRHQSGQISLTPHDGSSWCDTCLIEVTSRAERAALAAVNQLDQAVWDVQLFAKGQERDTCAALIASATFNILERRLGLDSKGDQVGARL
jgi:hypothetical protein